MSALHTAYLNRYRIGAVLVVLATSILVYLLASHSVNESKREERNLDRQRSTACVEHGGTVIANGDDLFIECFGLPVSP